VDKGELIMNIEQLQKENDELKAHIERLRELINGMIAERPGGNYIILTIGVSRLLDALEETPAQSLNHIKAQVEEETIERCIEEVDFALDKTTAYWAIRNMIRKYKEQSE